MNFVIQKIKRYIEESLKNKTNLIDASKYQKILNQLELDLYISVKPNEKIIDKISTKTGSQIKSILKQLSPDNLILPSSKQKLIDIANGMIILNDIIPEFERLLIQNYSGKQKRKSSAKKPILSQADIDILRDRWLKSTNFSELKNEMKKYRLKDLKLITKQWRSNLKNIGRSTDDYIRAVITYIEKIHNLTLFGT